MDIKIWSSPVRFEAGLNQHRIVASTHEAARVLIHHWPIREGEAYHEARQACLDALEGKVPAHAARSAFVRACGEAGMCVLQ